MKSVLLVTPFFAPQSHAAVFRMYKLAKELPKFGIRPIVLTTDTNYNYKEDPGLLEALPDEVEVHRARYREPSWRGLKMLLGARDLEYKATGAAVKVREGGETASTDGFLKRSLRRPYNWLMANELNKPDAFWTWVEPAAQLGAKLIRDKGICAVVTSCHPYSANRVGRLLQQRAGVQWIADFRDPLTFCHRTRSERAHVFSLQKEIERETFEAADAVTGLAASYRLIYAELYPELQRLQFIATGVDESLIPQEPVGPIENTIVFTGEYLPSYSGKIFGTLKKALEHSRVPSDTKIKIYGYSDINKPRLSRVIEGLESHVEFVDHLPQGQLYREIVQSRAGMLNSGDESTWWTSFAKMVDFIALRKPVLADVAQMGEARWALQESGLGLFLDGKDDVETLASLFKDNLSLSVNEAYCDQYLSQHMAKSFADIINRF